MELTPAAKSRERLARLERLKADATTMETVYDHVANGGTLIDLCEVWDVTYASVMRWIDESEDRKKLYHDSIIARNEWTDEMLISELRKMVRFDIRALYNEDGTLKNIHELDADTARMVSATEVNDLFEGTGRERSKIGETKKVKLWDKLKALEMAGKSRRLFVDVHDHEGMLKLEDLVGKVNAAPANPVAPALAGVQPSAKPQDQPAVAPASAPAEPISSAPAETAPAPAEAPKPQQ